MKTEGIKIESVEQAHELIRQELTRMNEFFAEFDETLQRVLKRINAFIEDAPTFDMEEMVLESYCCFVRMLKLCIMVDSYKGHTEQMFINGREDLESTLKEEMAVIDNKLLRAVDDWVKDNVRVNEHGSINIETAFDNAIDCASLAEKLRMIDQSELFNNLDANARSQSNLVALERIVSLGTLPKDVEGQKIEDLLNGSLASDIVGGLLEGTDCKEDLMNTHLEILQRAPVYTTLNMHLFNYICIKLYATGWDKFKLVKDDNLIKRLTSQKILYWQSDEYRNSLDDLLVEELLDEGEPSAQKVREFKKKFMSEHKADLIVKKSKLCAGDDLRFAHELIESKVSLEVLQEYFFYEGVMIEIGKRSVAQDDKTEIQELLSKVLSSNGVTILANNIVQKENFGDNYSIQPGAKIVKEDNNGGREEH